MSHPTPPPLPAGSTSASEQDVVRTLFDLGRQVASVVDFDELLQRIPELIRRLIQFDAFAVYLLDEKRGELRIGYAVGYPDVPDFRVKLSQGIVGQVVATKQALVLDDVTADPHYIEVVPGMASSIAVPLIYKNKPIGALNILSRQPHSYDERDAALLRQFAATVSTALVNAQLFERQRLDAEAFETLAEIGREVAAVLDLDELLSRIAQLARRVVDYRTFGILLLDEETKMLEMKVAVKYARENRACRRSGLAKGSSATRRFIARPCSCPTCRRTRATSRSSTTCGRSSRCRCC